MEKRIIINGLEFNQDNEGNLNITDRIDKISTLIPLLKILQDHGYEDIYMDFCRTQSIYVFHINNQPERSKREDLDCKECKRIKWNIETECNPYILLSLIDESKMRCSEHCGNTVRDK